MATKTIYWGDTRVKHPAAAITGDVVEIRGEKFYRIANYDSMPPFLISVVSNSDHWMYVSSSGGLTCGRGSPDKALFPYDTDDNIHDSAAHTGPQTCLLVKKADRTYLWKPFCGDVTVYEIRRNLYKSLVGNRLIFEEINDDLGLVFSYSWANSDRFGFVKTSTLRNTGGTGASVEIIDGLRNLLPAGIDHDMQSRMSTLADAYKKAEIEPDTGTGIYSLSAIPTDGAEPCESLKATVAWCQGLENSRILLSDRQLGAFCAGLPVSNETTMNGQRGGFFVQADFVVPPSGEKDWCLVADVGLGPSDLQLLLNNISQGLGDDEINADIEAGTRSLKRLVGGADGCQISADELLSGRHFANTLFNIMRGGTFLDDYRIRPDDFLDFVSTWNTPLREDFSGLLAPENDPLTRAALLDSVESKGDAQMKRLVLEYLPLCFSRRHGDPSRPWNKFNIEIKAPDGKERLHYQGNWRDIFQNWEALAISYPEYIDSFITKFVNASTVDGYNPYHISRDGVDWEIPDPGDAWSNIGYWGDHQVNYLVKLLEFSRRYKPGRIEQLLNQDLFVYTDVPYRLKSYQALLKNPRDSIEFDRERAQRVAERVLNIGSDGRLVVVADGSICRVNLLEKLLVAVLCKLGNFVPGGGIWMNTQRPDWNDANNALAGFGLSIVTLCFLRRLLKTMAIFVADASADSFMVSTEVNRLFGSVNRLLGKTVDSIIETTGDSGRKAFMDEMGACASDYRQGVYGGLSGEKSAIEKRDLLSFINIAMIHVNHSLGLNRRPDGLFHSYNLIHFGASGYFISRLPEMLEGQVAMLSSGFLGPQDSLALLDALRKSNIYCPDRGSYLLYPDKDLPSFREKNLIPGSAVDTAACLYKELKSERREIVELDINGNAHFNGALRNAPDLHAAIARAGDISKEDETRWLEIFEAVFRHREFTGRSSTMFKYEGLGCIYWHMVSKLVLAISEVIDDAQGKQADALILDSLVDHFDTVREGLGLYKSPSEYGAIPLDPYSHTPGFTGAQQPGMTGQVKEDIITRFWELGVIVKEGTISFEPFLLRRDEFFKQDSSALSSGDEIHQTGALKAGSLAFSLCGIPVIYHLADTSSISVITETGPPEVIQGTHLGEAWSRSIFRREKRARKILVNLPEALIR